MPKRVPAWRSVEGCPHLFADEAAAAASDAGLRVHAPEWRLALDEQLPTGFALRPRLSFAGKPDRSRRLARQDAAALARYFSSRCPWIR